MVATMGAIRVLAGFMPIHEQWGGSSVAPSVCRID
jgi:hypothetical protein